MAKAVQVVGQNRLSASSQKYSFCFGMTNLEWLPIKVLYFLQYGALGSLIPFIVKYYESRGLTAIEIGIIEALFFSIGCISRPIFGAIADRTGKHRLVLGISLLVFTIFFFALKFTQTTESFVRHPVWLNCNSTTHSFEFKACDSSEAVVLNMSKIQSSFVLHHGDRGFRDNCSYFGNTCQVVCRNFISIQYRPHKITEPFSDLGLVMGSNNTLDERCSSFPLQTSESFNHVTLLCNNTLAMPCDLDCGCSSNRTDIDSNSYIEEADSNRLRLFLTFLMLRCIGAIPFGPSLSLSDSISYDILGHRHSGLWGQQRLFGTVAWAIVAGVLGFVIDTLESFDPVFYSFGVLGIAAAVVALFWLPKRLPHHQHDEDLIISPTTKRKKRLSFCTAVRSVFKIPLFCISCVVAVHSGMLIGVQHAVWPMFITSIGASYLVIGLATVVACALEIPSLFFAGNVVKHLGEVVCFILMFVGYTVRFTAYAFLDSSTYWWTLLIEVLHVFCFAFYYAAATHFTALIAPRGTSATVQSILHVSYFGIGLGIGTFLSTTLYELLGGFLALLCFAGFAALNAIVLFILYFAYIRKQIEQVNKPQRMDSYSPTLNPEASYVDEDDNTNENEGVKNMGLTDSLISSAPHSAEL